MVKKDSERPTSCPKCGPAKIYHYGVSPCGLHRRFKCSECNHAFQLTYSNAANNPDLRTVAIRMYLEGCTQTEISAQLGISFGSLRNILKGHKRGSTLPSCPRCDNDDTCKFGKADDRITQRYRCKSCKKTFT